MGDDWVLFWETAALSALFDVCEGRLQDEQRR